jgi:transposase InsO family protein
MPWVRGPPVRRRLTRPAEDAGGLSRSEGAFSDTVRDRLGRIRQESGTEGHRDDVYRVKVDHRDLSQLSGFTPLQKGQASAQANHFGDDVTG